MADTGDVASARQVLGELSAFIGRLRAFLYQTAESSDETVLAVRGTALKIIADIQLELDGARKAAVDTPRSVTEPAPVTSLPG